MRIIVFKNYMNFYGFLLWCVVIWWSCCLAWPRCHIYRKCWCPLLS